MVGDLSAWLKRDLELAIIYDFPSIEALSRYLGAGGEAAEAGGSSIDSGALGVGVVGEERGDLLVGEPSGQGEGAAGVGVNDGVGFGAEESAQVGPGTPGGEE
jgi:hypothetical protein